MKHIGIYKIENIINGKIYIGQSLDISTRITQHKSDLAHNRHPNHHLQNSYNKYGKDSFVFTILELCSASQLNKKEKYWIEHYGGKNCQCNYNEKDGGRINVHLSEEARKRCGTKNKGKHRSKETEFKKGQHRGCEFQKGHLPHNIKEVYKYDLKGVFLQKYSSIKEAALSNGISSSLITMCCKKQVTVGGGFQWRYKNDIPLMEIKLNKANRKKSIGKTIYQFTIDGIFIKKFNSIAEAAKEIKKSASSISACLSKKNHTCGGFQWRYEYNQNIGKAKTNKKKIQQFDLEHNLIKKYDSIKSLDREFRKNSSANIKKAIQNKKVAYGFFWDFIIE